jgi:hypothetical protein
MTERKPIRKSRLMKSRGYSGRKERDDEYDKRKIFGRAPGLGL